MEGGPVHGAILNETIACVTDILGRELEGIAVERAVIGLFFTGVKLTAGPNGEQTAGTCATPRDAIPGDICCPVSARAAGFQTLAGRPAAELMQGALAENGLTRAVGIATLNALAELCWRRRPNPGVALLAGADAFDASDIREGERVVLVGAFIPFLKELKRRRQPYLVLEQNPAALKAEEMAFYRPADLAPEVVPAADVLLITGATLLNDTLEDLLALADPAARVTVLGPTVGMLPDAFLARGADILGSIRITRPDAFLDLLAEGGSAPHFLGHSAEKIVLARRQAGLQSNAA
jgi:uncharacterized protein (DUF4213/DUF364 family)